VPRTSPKILSDRLVQALMSAARVDPQALKAELGGVGCELKAGWRRQTCTAC